MITAIEAKDISNTLQTQRAKECLEEIDKRVKSAASKGYVEIDITDLKPVNAVLSYLASIGYTIPIVEDSKYNTPLSITLKW